jgi:hypothetical protein
MIEISDDQYESNNTSCEESDKTDSSSESDESSTSDRSGKSGKLKRKRTKKKGIFYYNLDLFHYCSELLIFIILL